MPFIENFRYMAIIILVSITALSEFIAVKTKDIVKKISSTNNTSSMFLAYVYNIICFGMELYFDLLFLVNL